MAHVVVHVDTRGVPRLAPERLNACAPEVFRFFLPGAAWRLASALLSSFFLLSLLS